VYSASRRCAWLGSRSQSPLNSTCKKPWFQRVRCLMNWPAVGGVSSRVT
jgi:hypothetical protein